MLSIVGECRKPPDEFKRNFNKHRMRLEEAIVLELPEETAQPAMLGPVSHCKTTNNLVICELLVLYENSESCEKYHLS